MQEYYNHDGIDYLIILGDDWDMHLVNYTTGSTCIFIVKTIHLERIYFYPTSLVVKDLKYIECLDLLLMLFKYSEDEPLRLYDLSYFIDNSIYNVKLYFNKNIILVS